jgi:hypothetical protein
VNKRRMGKGEGEERVQKWVKTKNWDGVKLGKRMNGEV